MESRSLPSREQISGILKPVVEALGGIPGINNRLRDVDVLAGYALATQVYDRSYIGFIPAETSSLINTWANGEVASKYEVMIVGPKQRKVIPDSPLGAFFKPVKSDYVQIRNTTGSQMIGLAIIHHDINTRVSNLTTAMREAQATANRLFEKQYYEEPIAFFSGSLGTQKVRAWALERDRAEEEGRARIRAEELTGQIEGLQGEQAQFEPIRDLLEPRNLKLLLR